MLKRPTNIVSATVIARWCGVSEREVTDLARRGIVMRKGRGAYVLEASVRNSVTHLRRAAAQHGDAKSLTSMRDERIKLTRAQAQHAELKNKTLAGELVDAAQVESTWSATLRDVRAGMLAVPSRCAARLPHLSAHDLAELDAEVRAALTEVGGE